MPHTPRLVVGRAGTKPGGAHAGEAPQYPLFLSLLGPLPSWPLTLHVQHNKGLCEAGRIGGVADVLPRVLLGHPRDDEGVVLHLMLPWQGGPQL